MTIHKLYGSIAPNYDKLHARWLKYAGGEAQCAFEGAVYALVKPGIKLLDVGCGTGNLARKIAKLVGSDIDLTLLDTCPEFLSRTLDIPNIHRVHSSAEFIPSADQKYDLVTCAWALETTRNTTKAITELVRITKSDGHICVVFCADKCRSGLTGRAMRTAVTFRGTGKFLDPELVIETLNDCAVKSIRQVPCNGPAVTLVVNV